MAKIESIHQIEMTSKCNLRCKYCVHPHMERSKIHMSEEIWIETLWWVERFIERGTQGHELNLCGIGESTMHPKFCDWVLQARHVIGEHRDLILATNGVDITEEHAQAMKDAQMKVWVSLHRPERAGLAVPLLKRYGVLAGVSVDPSIAAIDWAGKVDWPVTIDSSMRTECPWLKHRRVMVASNGDILTCCLDGNGDGTIGHILKHIDNLEQRPYILCVTCHHTLP